jgi:hypothetical protein
MGVIRIEKQMEALSGAAPSAAEEGVSLEGAKNYRIIISATAGQTLSGAGAYKVYAWHADAGWAEDPRLAGSVSSSGVRSIVLDEREIGPSAGRIRVVFTGLTTSDSQPVSVLYILGN